MNSPRPERSDLHHWRRQRRLLRGLRRGASFSSIATSSCRLSRHHDAARTGYGHSRRPVRSDSVRDFDAAALRAQLRHDGVALNLETGYLDAMSDVEPLEAPR